MGLRFRRKETIPSGVRRMMREQIDRIVADLTGKSGVDLDTAVHGTRRRLKRVRSLLRLVRHDLGEKGYRRESDCFRACAARLAAARDARVLIETFAKLAPLLPGPRRAQTVGLVSAMLEQRYRRVMRRGPDLRKAVPVVVRHLRQARGRLAKWPLRRDDWAALGTGLHATYRKCRRRGAQALESGAAEDLHAWRKFAKYLWHQTEIISPAWPAALKPLAGQWRQLSALLGEHHDLAALAATLRENESELGGRQALAPVVRVIRARQDELHRQASQLGAGLLGEKTGAFEERLESCWKAWRDEP